MQIPTFDPRPDIRLIAADMDGTLLDDDNELHEHFWPLVHELNRRGILFCPASGRQYFNLRERFADIADEIVFIAENGTYVVHRDREVSSDCLELSDARRLVSTVRETVAAGVDAGIVVCGKRSAYIERTDALFRAEIDRYYTRLEVVDDLLEVSDDEVLKVSVFDFGSAEHSTAPGLAGYHQTHLVTVSSAHWVDITSLTANKGQGDPAPAGGVRHHAGADDGVRRLPQRSGDDGRRRLLVRDGQRAPAAARARPLYSAAEQRERRGANDFIGTGIALAGLNRRG